MGKLSLTDRSNRSRACDLVLLKPTGFKSNNRNIPLKKGISAINLTPLDGLRMTTKDLFYPHLGGKIGK